MIRLIIQLVTKFVEGEKLSLTGVLRSDMGGYLCIASNGIPPSVSKRYQVQVNCEFLFEQIIRFSRSLIDDDNHDENLKFFHSFHHPLKQQILTMTKLIAFFRVICNFPFYRLPVAVYVNRNLAVFGIAAHKSSRAVNLQTSIPSNLSRNGENDSAV